MRTEDELKFAADKMLGRLAKWLRIIGQDVIHGQHLAGQGLVRAATQEHRVMLTRDRRISRRNPDRAILIRDDHFRAQLKQVVEDCGLDPFAGILTRCVECNQPLQPMPKEQVRDTVPPYVFETQDVFSACPACRRVFWPATHQQQMMDELEGLGFVPPGN
ncbi:MAG: Mut7-C RNAse domain-containing protein [Deltaproteobacteria bacterium]|nr:Mut7-C RNAse domain-containing protein [Deltaproteobacteria bacterium]